METPNLEPLSLNAGDTLRFTRSLPEYPASSYTLAYTLRATSGDPITFSASAQGDAFLVDVPAATTATWPAGSYAMSARVSDGAGFVVSIPVAAPSFTIRPDPATSTPTTTLPWAESTLAAVETAIAQLSAKIHQSVTVNGTTYAYTDLEKLLSLRQRLKNEVNALKNAAKLATGDYPNPRQILTRFTRGR